jgi:hypothetical protein
VARERQIETGTGAPVPARLMSLLAPVITGSWNKGWARLIVDAPYRAEDYDLALALLTDLHIHSFTGTGIDPDLSGAYSDRRGLGENLWAPLLAKTALAKIPAQALVGIMEASSRPHASPRTVAVAA